MAEQHQHVQNRASSEQRIVSSCRSKRCCVIWKFNAVMIVALVVGLLIMTLAGCSDYPASSTHTMAHAPEESTTAQPQTPQSQHESQTQKSEQTSGAPWMDEERLKEQLSPEQYRVTQQCGTEPPFTGKYWNHKAKGTYHCVVCELPLFASETKFESGSGWPSYFQPVDNEAVRELQDTSHGMIRTEIRCGRCDAHLGHVFEDGPRPTGLRYCINSAALQFKPAQGEGESESDAEDAQASTQ